MFIQPPHAAILAAGLGSRFGGVAKALIDVNGKPLLRWAVESLAGCGLSKFTVVTGHRAADVRRFLEQVPVPADVQLIDNPRYAELNNFYTLLIACEQCPDGHLLVMNSDTIVAPTVLDSLLSTSGGLVLAVEDGAVDAEALKVRVSEGRVRELGKHLDPRASAGEFIGLSLMDEPT